MPFYDTFYASPRLPPPLPPPPPAHITGVGGQSLHYPHLVPPTYAGDCPHTCTHHPRKRSQHRSRGPRNPPFIGLLRWLRDLFSCLCCGAYSEQYHYDHRTDENPWMMSPLEQRLAYLQRAKDMRCGHFSPRFLAETRAARKNSRLNLDALVKDTDNGILSTQSLESLELELLEKSLKKRRRHAPLHTNWSTSQPILHYRSNAHNSAPSVQRHKERSKSTPSLSAEQ